MKKEENQLSKVDEEYLEYRDKIFKSADKGGARFRAHLIPWVAVNSFLVFLNLFTSPGFPWAAFPAAAWGIGLVTHYASFFEQRRRKREFKTLPKLNGQQFRLLKKLQKKRKNFLLHFVSNAAVSGFLCMVNLITSPGFLWFLIPSAGMAMGAAIHWSNILPDRKKLKKNLIQALNNEQAISSVTDDWPDKSRKPSLLKEAERIQTRIVTHLQDLEKKGHLLGEDIPGVLSNYINQIGVLTAKGQEIDQIMGEMPIDELQVDKDRLEKRLQNTDDSIMKIEYRKSIEDINRQLNSCKEMEKHQEIIALRTTSAINNLKQMQLDLVRMKSMGTDEQPAFELLREKTEDFSIRLKDLTEGYEELDF